MSKMITPKTTLSRGIQPSNILFHSLIPRSRDLTWIDVECDRVLGEGGVLSWQMDCVDSYAKDKGNGFTQTLQELPCSKGKNIIWEVLSYVQTWIVITYCYPSVGALGTGGDRPAYTWRTTQTPMDMPL